MLPLAALLLGLCAPPGELAGWLERAGSADAVERERAQRWLATHLEAADAEPVAARAAGGDAEVRERLRAAIGGEPRLVELAARLALRAEPAAAELGREALREQVLAFDPGAEEPLGGRIEWLFELRPRFSEALLMPAEPRTRSAAEIFDLLARAEPGAPPIVLDPRVQDTRGVAGIERTPQALPELLLRCAGERELQIVGFGFGTARAARPWLLVAPQVAARADMAQLLAHWVQSELDPRTSSAERMADARALAAVEWPAGLAFLESRWKQGDEAALEGLLLAAGRGRVAPALAEPARQRALYARFAALCADPKDLDRLAQASALARALAAAGPLSRTGEMLGPLALEGFAQAAPREQWLRLAVLEGQGRAFSEALAAADALLASNATPAALAVEALRVRAALAGRSSVAPQPAAPLALLEWASDARRRVELVDLWSGLALGWPAEWNGLEARGSAVPLETRGLLVELAALAGADEAARAGLRALAAERANGAFDALVGVLARLAARDAARVRALADSLPAGEEAAQARASAATLLAGLEAGPRESACLERWLSAGAASAEELAALASQATGPRGAEVRARLLEQLGPALPLEARLSALERAAAELARRGPSELEGFATAVRERARKLGDAPLRARVRPGRWPTPPAPPGRDLGRDERELASW